MYLIVMQSNRDAHIEVVEHTHDYLLTGKPWNGLLSLDNLEEVKDAIDILKPYINLQSYEDIIKKMTH